MSAALAAITANRFQKKAAKMRTSSKNSGRLNRSASVVAILLTLCLLTGGVSEAGDEGKFAYVGEVTGTKICAGPDANGILKCAAIGAKEESNVGGDGTQDSTMIIVPIIDPATGGLTALMGIGRSISHKTDGLLYVDFVLYEKVGPEFPAGAFSGIYVISGGTGRYEGSRGTGTITGYDSGVGPFQNRYEGTLMLKKPRSKGE